MNNRYKILELVGEGGMATIYRAEDLRLKRIVAIKVLSEKLARDGEILSRFIREAQSAARLVHPNIVNIFDIGESDGINYIVMEYLESRNLKDIIQDNAPYSPDVALKIFLQVAEALKFAHENGIIHRDVKPQNVLVTGNGIFKVTDFGIARAITSSTLTRTGTMMGSVQYFSPEQAQGKPVDRTTDIYSLGIMLYEILSGRLPFEGENPVSIALKQVQEEAPPLSSVNRNISPAVNRLVMKSLSKDPGERYQDMDEFIRAAKQVLSGAPIERAAVESSRAYEEEEEEEDITVSDVRREFDSHEKKARTMRDNGREEQVSKNENGTRKGMPVFIILLMAFLFFITLTLYKRGELGLMFNRDVVPDLEGISLTEAREKVDKQGWQIQIEGEIYHPKVPEGIIISQRPGVGEKLPRGSNIFVSISMGKPRVEVPQLSGLTLSRAKVLLEERKLGWIVQDSVNSDTVPKDVVVSQDPKAGENVSPGRKIFLTISLGSEKMEVPDLTGMEKEKADEEAAKRSLTVIIGEKQNSTKYPEGRIISQVPPAGKMVERGSTITVVISSGPEVLTAPALVGKTLGEAMETLDIMKISLEVTDGTVDKNARIIGQDPPADSKMDKKVLKVWCQDKALVPNLIGKSLEDAQNVVYESGLKVRIKYLESSMKPGTVLEQNPENGASIERGGQIEITISKKPAIPSVEPSSTPTVVEPHPGPEPSGGIIIVPDNPKPGPTGGNDDTK